MYKHITTLLALAVLASPAWAVYKCTGTVGRTVYQDAPCPDGTGNLEKESGVPTQKNVVPITDVSKTLEADLNQKIKNYVPPPAATSSKEDQTASEVIKIGMSAERVLELLGNPSRKNTHQFAAYTNEQWVYRQGRYSTEYVYLRNGIVTSISSHSH